jgi:RNA polymerase sigma-70 factor (ECF subfamily)
MASSPITDRTVIDEILAGNPRAYTSLVDRYKDRALTMATRLVGDRAEAEELVQDAFVRAYRSLERFRGESSFGTWFYRILYNLCMTAISRKRERPRQFTGDEEDALDAAMADPGEQNALERMEEEEMQSMITEEVNLLPEKMKSAVLLFYVEGMSYDQMAEVLQFPLGTVKTNLFRGRTLLRARVLRRVEKEVHAA